MLTISLFSGWWKPEDGLLSDAKESGDSGEDEYGETGEDVDGEESFSEVGRQAWKFHKIRKLVIIGFAQTGKYGIDQTRLAGFEWKDATSADQGIERWRSQGSTEAPPKIPQSTPACEDR